MDFLKKIKNRLFPKKKKHTFYDQIQQEKKQKYLFRSDEEDLYVSKRSIRKTLLGKEKVIQKHPGYTSFFQKSIEKIAYNSDLKHIMGIIWLFLIILVTYIVAFSPYFQISPSKIIIEPISEGIDTTIVQRATEKAYGQSIFTLNEEQIAKNIQKNLPNIEFIRIDRLFPNGMKVLVKSLPISFDATIFGVENKRFWVSDNGVLIALSDLQNTEFHKHLRLMSPDLPSELFLSYKKVISDRSMLVIRKIFDLFEKEWTDLLIVEANYFTVEKELHIILESNTKIIFALQSETGNNSDDFSKNLLGQLVTLQTYIAENRNKLADGSMMYIDARIPGKIFACSDPGLCRQNLISVYGSAYEK